MESSLVKDACALLDAQGARGTGFLVSPERLLTCHHVVKHVDDGPIVAVFAHGRYEARVELIDAEHDCALLRLTAPVPARDARPLTLATAPAARGAAWEGYGFPAATGRAGLLIEGDLQDPLGQDPALRPALVLRSANITAGSWLNGFSGSPVLIDGQVVGQMRQIIPDGSGGAQLAVVYACPASFLNDLARHRLGTAPYRAHSAHSGSAPRGIFFVPQPLNPHFTGREELLATLRQQLHDKQTVALWGFGGIGKTQTAVAFAHRYREEYAAVLWLPADSPGSFAQGLLELARSLLQAGRLREELCDRQDPAALRQAVLDHLRQTSDYLLICDNADAPAALRPVWPRALGGHVLLTSRSQEVRRLGAVVLELGNLTAAESQALLVRCYPPRGAQEEQALAALATELGGLPLALGQAAAYLTRHRSRYDGYLRGYQQKKLLLLEKGLPDDDYPYSVASTWALNIEQLEKTSPASLELLQLCALLQPDAIPEELFTDPAPERASELGEALRAALQAQKDDAQALDDLLAPLLCYALVQRDPDSRTLSLHRLVQQAVLHQLAEAEQARLVRAAVAQLDGIFPPNLFASWSKSRRLLPQALTLFEHIERFAVTGRAAGHLLHSAGYFLSAQGQHSQAELLVRRALAILEKSLGDEHLEVASILNTLGDLLYNRAPQQDHPSDSQAQYLEAELLVRRSLTIREEALGAEHPEVASSLNNLAALLHLQGKSEEAEQLFRRALSTLQQSLGAQHPDLARSLNNLGLFLHGQGQSKEAEELYRRALLIWDAALGPEHPTIAYALLNLGLLLESQDRRAEAEPVYRRALAIREKGLPANHPLIERTRDRLRQVTLAGPWRELSSK